MQWPLLIAGLVLIALVTYEMLGSPRLFEGFTTLNDVIRSTIPRRYDITLENPGSEEPGYYRDLRYYAGYADVQRLGIANDFCRIVQQGRTGPTFFACALAGTENLDPYSFRTPSTREDFQLSRDDYMSGSSYCRVLRAGDGTWQSFCNPSTLTGFQSSLVRDPSPPDAIRRILTYYNGILMWFRFHDDMVDYAKNAKVFASGKIAIDETPSRRDNPPANGQPMTEGLHFNGVDQYLRIGEDSQLSFGTHIPLATVRTVSFWVKWDAFTNWAHVFDFGDGGNKNSVWCGIEAHGNPGIDTGGDVQPHPDGPLMAAQDNEICKPAPQAPEVSPQLLMLTSAANVDTYACPLPDSGADEAGKPIALKIVAKPPTANFIFEIWDQEQRKMRIVIQDFYVLGQWTQVTITTTSSDSQRPTWRVYKNGRLTAEHEGGWLAQTSTTTHNYFGRSNDENPESTWRDRTERFNGSLYDFRLYQIPVSQAFIEDVVAWGREALVERQKINK